MQNPYRYVESSQGYTFTTDRGVTYQAYFTDSGYFFQGSDLEHLDLFSFNLEPVGSAGPIQFDQRVKDTVSLILNSFFQVPDRILIFVCDSTDKRHRARDRKFQVWFSSLNPGYLEKHDFLFVDGETEIISSLLIPSNHSWKEKVIPRCRELAEAGGLK